MPIKKRIYKLLGLDGDPVTQHPTQRPAQRPTQQSRKPAKAGTSVAPTKARVTTPAAQPIHAPKPAIGQLKPLRSMAPRNAEIPLHVAPRTVSQLERTVIQTNDENRLNKPNAVINRSLPPIIESVAEISQLDSAPADGFTDSHWQQTQLHTNYQQKCCHLDNVPATNITHEYAGEPELSITTHDPIVTEMVNHSHKHQLQRKITHEKHLFQHEEAVQPIIQSITAEQVLHSQQLPELRHQSTKMQASAAHEEDLKRKLEQYVNTLPETKHDIHEYQESLPHVHEIIHRHIIREVHPVVRRDVHVHHLHQDYQHLHEIHFQPITYKDLEILETLSYDAWQTRMQELGIRREVNKPAFTDF